MQRRLLLGAWVAVLGAASACSSAGKNTHSVGIADGTYTPNDVSLIAPSQAIGTISGQVIDATGTPISGATVKAALPAGASSVQTDSNGGFGFTKVPGGTSVGITITKTGYTTAYSTATVPDSAGNVPEDNTNAFVGPVQLFATTGTFSVSVVGFDGSLVGASGIARISPAFGIPAAGGGGGESYLGATTVNATANNGAMTFSGVPDFEQLAAIGNGEATIAIAIDPTTAGSGGSNYGGATLYLTVSQALSSPGLLSVVLPDVSQGAPPLAIIGSSLGSLVNGPGAPTDSLISASASVSIAFNQPVIGSSVGITLVRQDGSIVSPTIATTMSPNVITFSDPSGNGFLPEAGYQVTVQAIAANSHPETQSTFSGQMFTQANENQPSLTHAYFTPSSTGTLAPGSVVSVGFDSPVGLPGGSPVLAAYFDADVSFPADGKRTQQGEYDVTGLSKAGGWQLTPDPKYAGVNLNGFYTNFVFTYTGAASLTPGKPVLVLFDDPLTAGDTSLEWITGLPLTVANSPGQNGEVALTVAPTPP